MTSILLVLLTAALGASLVVGEVRKRYWQGLHDQVREIYEDTQEQMVEAHVELERSQSETKWLKLLFERPIVATLSDAQFNQLVQTILSSLHRDPNLLN